MPQTIKPPTQTACAKDDIGRRTHVDRSGSAFSAAHFDKWTYNDRNELTGSDRFLGTFQSPGTAQPTLDREYEYDPIGNRRRMKEGNDPNVIYASNSLNQYWPDIVKQTTPASAQRLLYDDDGNLIEGYVAGDINGDGSVNQSDLGAMNAAMGTCEGDAGYNANANFADSIPTNCTNPDRQGIDQADLGVLMSYYGLTATDTLRATLSWDAENRLVAWEPQQFGVGAKRVTFAYDYLGRRVEKKVYTWDPNAGSGGQWTPATAGWRRLSGTGG